MAKDPSSPKRTASEVGRSNVRTAKSHERRIKSLFTDWSGVPFRRRRATGRDDSMLVSESAGDVIAVDRKIRFNIEAKKGKDFAPTALLSNPTTNTFAKWYFQSSYDAKLSTAQFGYQVYPLVILKPNVNEDWVALSISGYESLRPKEGRKLYDLPHLVYTVYEEIGPMSMNVSHTSKKSNEKIETLQLESCLFMRWKDFAAQIDPSSFFYDELLQ